MVEFDVNDYYNKFMKLHAITGPRNARLKFQSETLRQLALSSIVSNINFFWDKYLRTRTNPFSCLPDTLKTDLLELSLSKGFSKEHNSYFIDIIPWLLNNAITKFVFPEQTSFTPQLFSNTWKWLTLECPRLQKITWTGGCKEIYSIKATFFTNLVQFKDLQIIEMGDIACDDLDLCRLAANLPKLRLLEVTMDDSVSEVGFKALAKLEHLTELLCDTNNLETRTKCFYFCMQLLPRLHFSEIKFPLTPYDIVLEPLCFVTMNAILMLHSAGLEAPCKLALRRITLKGVANIPNVIKLHNLDSLTLHQPSEDFQSDDQLNKVTELGLFESSNRTCNKILKSIGKQLHTLSLSTTGNIYVENILNLCPNLIKLKFEHEPTKLCFDASRLNPEAMMQLEQLFISAGDYGANHLEKFFQPDLLLQLLRAPKLRRLFIYMTNLRQEEADSIIEEVKEQKILQELQVFSYRTAREENVSEEFRELYAEYKTRIESFTLEVARHCPQLTNVNR